MKPTQVLKEEHQGIKRMLTILETVCHRLDAGDSVPAEHLESITEFIQVFADRCHHGKEEDLLFCSLEQVGLPRDQGPIGVMLQEHDVGRGYVRDMADAIAHYKAGERSASADIIRNARSFITLLREHIDKEDNILYPIADMHLSQQTQDDLVGEFERVEIEKIGHGRHEEFHHLIDELEEIYVLEKEA